MTDATQQQALEQGSYELIKRRLSNFGSELKTHVDELNKQRVAEFGNSELKVAGRVRVRTEHNCIPRDIVIVGDKVIFAYNVFIGLKKNIHISDVFSVHKLVSQEEHFEIEPYPHETRFLTDARFLRDFEELYTYYKEAKLQHLYQHNGKLFALFQIGEKLSDVKVFRWQIDPDNTINYIDNRGERDIQTGQDYDFEWLQTDRSHHVEGRFPHVNLADKVFVETLGGNLTIKVENNTEDGEGVYQEPVEDKNQSLADCAIEYALLGDLVLLKVLPYREKVWRYFIFNSRSNQVLRQDAIGDACVSLPDDHGIIYPGGYYLQSGQTRYFEDKTDNLEFHRQIKSPNGEDVLYVFYEPHEGRYALYAYNLIEKNLQNPIYCHGYGLYDDGTALTFKADNEAPERIHPIQIWHSAFVSAEFAANAPAATSMLGKIGNPDLVRGLSDLYSVHKAINEQNPSAYHYEDLISLSRNIFDRYHWLSEDAFSLIQQTLHQIFETSEQVLDEFEKISEIRDKAKQAVVNIENEYQTVSREIRPDSFKEATQFVAGLDALKLLTGKVIGLEDVKFIDISALNTIKSGISAQLESLSLATAKFLQNDEALQPYHQKLAELEQLSEQSDSVTELKQYVSELDEQSVELDLLNHTMLDLEIEDSRVRTKILEDISAVYALVNRAKANIQIKQKSLGSVEAKAEFAARFKLFSQSITNGLNNAKTPQACDEQLSRLLIQLEELESQFSDFDEFLAEIVAKRDDVYESFEAHKQSLNDQSQRRALNLANAAERILQGVTRRAQSFNELDELNTYFAADPMISKLRSLTDELKALGNEVRAEDIQAKLKACKDQGIRSLRDKQDIYTDGGNTVSIGKHAFSVNKQVLDLTLLPRDEQLMLHLTGTDYFEPIDDQAALETLEATRHLWQQTLVSESDEVYRGEYLAAQILATANNSDNTLTFKDLLDALEQGELLRLVQKFAEPRYQEGYEKGIHDHDACAILTVLLEQKKHLDLLIYPASCRVVAQLYILQLCENTFKTLCHQARNALLMEQHFSSGDFINSLCSQFEKYINEFLANLPSYIPLLTDFSSTLTAEYLAHELAVQPEDGKPCFALMASAKEYAEKFANEAKVKGFEMQLASACEALTDIDQQAVLYFNWISAFAKQQQISAHIRTEAANYALLTHLKCAQFRTLTTNVTHQVESLMGQHRLIESQILPVDFAEFNARTSQYITQQVPAFERYHQLRSKILAEQKQRLQLDEFKARPLSSFVRNQLIDKVYFPLIGDNLAKQIGSSGKNKRTDLMGMLLLISPPGYGKTTLIEYVANRLGLTFVKVNCPSIGHDQVSLDPAQAINATAAKEILKINQSFEMGNNVMLYLDDIQHTNPEFLQKFISLCDGSRRIDGVWNGQSKTYDLRGKKFAVVMAGNPYTESGESFKIPDMLANRADIYNLGDTLAGCEQEFAMSFIENSLTSNRVLAPLANRNMQDLYKLIRIVEGEDISLNELEYGYSQAEANEITSVLRKLMWLRDTVLKVNAQYIASAAQDDKYREEPPFKLQGSYRNMNKLTEKVVAAMNDQELENLLQDHYRGEAQTLSKGSEENLLKLAELRGTLSEQEQQRWAQIKQEYRRANKLDSTGSPVMMAVEQLGLVYDALSGIANKLSKTNLSHDYTQQLAQWIGRSNSNEIAEKLDELNRTLASELNAAPYQSGFDKLAASIELNTQTLSQSSQRQAGAIDSISKSVEATSKYKEQTMEKALKAQNETLRKSVKLYIHLLSQSMDKLANALTSQDIKGELQGLAKDIHSLMESASHLAQQPVENKATVEALGTISNVLAQLTHVQEQRISAQHANAQRSGVDDEQLSNMLNAIVSEKVSKANMHPEPRAVDCQTNTEVKAKGHSEEIESLLPKQPLP